MVAPLSPSFASLAFRTPPHRHSPLVLALAWGLLAQIPLAHAQTTAPPTSRSAAVLQWNLPAGPLGDTLARIAREGGRRISADPALLAGKQAAPVVGALSAEQAAQRALAGSGLQLAVTTSGTLTVVPGNPPAPVSSSGDSATLKEVTVKAAPELNGVTEGSTSYTATGPSRMATGLSLTQRETPQAVTVVTQQQILDQNMQSLDDVANAATGISYSKNGTERSVYYARGLQVSDLQIDGMSVSMSENYSMDAMSGNNLVIYDRVEFMRGANGLMQGSGNPSGAINLVRKRPTREFQLKGEVGAGSWADYRAQVDVAGPLNEAGTLRGRAVAYANNGNSYKTGSGKDNQLLYGILEADLSPDTLLTLGATVQRDRHRGYEWGGLNTRPDGSFYQLPRSTSLAGPWAHLNRDNYTLFSELSHQFGNGWKVTGAVNVMRSNADYLASYPARVSGSDNLYRLVAVDVDYTDKQLAFDLKASGPFTLWGREHELMLGASHRKDDFAFPIYSATNTPIVDITNFDYWAIPAPIINYAKPANYRYQRSEKGLYAATRLRATDALSVIIGSRLSWAEYDVQSPYVNEPYATGRQFIPYAGLVYDLNGHHSLYASYTSIYQIQDYFGPGGLLDPVKGNNYETGIKSSFFDSRLQTALSVFQSELTNLPEELDLYPTCGTSGTSSCYTEGGKVRNRGFEIEASGSPLPGWNLSAGYSYSHPKYVQGSSQGMDYDTLTPRKLLKLATDYRLPGDQWRLGGDVQMQSGTHSSLLPNLAQGGYTLLNLHANYQHDRHLSVQFNVRNATDKHYYQTIPSRANWGNLMTGTPRSFAVTVRYQY